MSALGSRTLLRDDPHVDWEEDTVEFRLTYNGPLLAETNRDGAVRRARAEHKHQIRRAFHTQLKRWWELSPYLRESSPIPMVSRGGAVFGRLYYLHSIPKLAEQFSMFGYRFVPLVTRELELLCSVEILFLRQGDPGALISRAGDIDNRLKTLFDAMAMPRNAAQLGGAAAPAEGEDPFFCLLEDDSVITKASVETDTLLQAASSPPDPNDCRLVITVRIRPGRVTAQNVGFAS